MKIIIGLGNPGIEYKQTRHNAGIELVNKIYEIRFKNYEYGFRKHKNIFLYESKDLVLVKTAGVFMNESGNMIYELRNTKYDLNSIYIAHDDLDLKLGEYKIQFGKGPKEHNGLTSVEQALGTKDFWRIRIGIDNREEIRDTRYEIRGEEYVLQKFSEEEINVLNNVIESIGNEIFKATN